MPHNANEITGLREEATGQERITDMENVTKQDEVSKSELIERLEVKSAWCVLLDFPACVIMFPAILAGIVCTIIEIGYTFGRHHTEKWFMRPYNP